MEMSVIPSLSEAESIYKRTIRVHIHIQVLQVILCLVQIPIFYLVNTSVISMYQGLLVSGISFLTVKIKLDSYIKELDIFTTIVNIVQNKAIDDKKNNISENPYASSIYPAVKNIYTSIKP